MNTKVVKKDTPMERESFIVLLGQLANNSAAVFHHEIELVTRGIHEKVRAVRGGVLTVATGAVIGFAALMPLCAALIIELSSYMAPVIAALAASATLAFIGAVIVFIGCKKLKKSILKINNNAST